MEKAASEMFLISALCSTGWRPAVSFILRQEGLATFSWISYHHDNTYGCLQANVDLSKETINPIENATETVYVLHK